mmetsp:Transcript_1733/g.4363  ORF Transcript_1733/g.4363 Transcript_1733/m.4363 type:complete len:289 (+) Transcript_1733:139-1005(+)
MGSVEPDRLRTGKLRDGATRLILRALVLRLVLFRAITWLREANSVTTNEGGLEAVVPFMHGLSSLVQSCALCVALFSERARRSAPLLLLWSACIANGVREACDKLIINRESRDPGDIEEDDFLEFFTLSFDNQAYAMQRGSSILAIPVSIFVVWKMCGHNLFPGIISGPLLAALLPTVLARMMILLSGYGTQTWGSLLRTLIAGATSSIAVLWLLLDIRRLSRGRTVLNNTFELPNDDISKSSSASAYVALRAFVNFMIIPIWVLVLWFRTCVWVLTCGMVFSAKQNS